MSTGPDGSFTLPMYEGAHWVMAANSEGFARISVEELQRSSQITLQKWGRIEGTLQIRHRPGSNEVVTLNPPTPNWSTMRISPAGGKGSALSFTNASRTDFQPLLYDSMPSGPKRTKRAGLSSRLYRQVTRRSGGKCRPEPAHGL